MRSYIFIILMLLMLGGCSSSAEPQKNFSREGKPAYGDIMVEGSIGDASNLIPILSSDNSSHEISGRIFNGLVKYDKDIKVVGYLAES